MNGERDGLLIYKEARVQQQGWVHASSEWEGYKTNVRQGLGTFNSTVVDHAWTMRTTGTASSTR